HIQLLIAAGLPLSLLALHRLVDRPSARRGFALGIIMVAQALFCGYYAIFVALIVGYGVLVLAAFRSLWRSPQFWKTVALAGAVAAVGGVLLFLPYSFLQQSTGFGRTLDAARQYSADWRAYFASSAYAHAWILRLIGHWKEVLFPGFVALTFGTLGAFLGWFRRGRARELAALYGGLVVLVLWASLGPDAGLYSVLYRLIPLFS